MVNYYNKKKCTTNNQLKKGYAVSFQVPKIDRSCTDLQRIPCVIIDVSAGKEIQFYQVATTAGVIKTKFRTGDLTVYNGSVSPNTDKYLSIRKAAHQINSSNRFTVNRCKCKGKCYNGQCSCIRSNISYTNHCHPSRSCENKELTTDSQTKTSNLSKVDTNILLSGWLTDKHMFAANQVIKKRLPNCRWTTRYSSTTKLFLGCSKWRVCAESSCQRKPLDNFQQY